MPTQQETLSQMAEVLFDNTEKIPEGVYLRLMNLCRDLSKVQRPPTPPPPVINFKPIYWVKYPNKYEFQGVGANHNLYSVFEVLDPDTPNKKTFYRVIKSNDKSILADMYKFEACWTDETKTAVVILYEEKLNQKLKYRHLKEMLVRESGSTQSFNRLKDKAYQRVNQVPIHINEVILWEFNIDRIEATI